MRPNLRHIAEECGVSRMAVSKALRGHSSISEQRRIEIKAIAERIGYQPNISAISLRGGKSHSIGILWSLSGPHDSVGLIRDISLKLMNNNYVSYISDSLGDPKIINSCLKDYVARNIDGLIIQVHTQAEYDNLTTKEVRQNLKQIKNVVIVNDTGNELPAEMQVDEILRCYKSATQEIVDYLVSCGRKKIVLLAVKLTSWREQQFIDCLNAHNLDCEHCRIVVPDGSLAFVANKMLSIIKSNLRVYDAILVSNDEAAAQVIKYLQQQGVKVPEDIAVIGFNNSRLSPYIEPPIASVERHSAEIASKSVDLLLKRIKHRDMAMQQISIPMTFVKRASAG